MKKRKPANSLEMTTPKGLSQRKAATNKPLVVLAVLSITILTQTFFNQNIAGLAAQPTEKKWINTS